MQLYGFHLLKDTSKTLITMKLSTGECVLLHAMLFGNLNPENVTSLASNFKLEPNFDFNDYFAWELFRPIRAKNFVFMFKYINLVDEEYPEGKKDICAILFNNDVHAAIRIKSDLFQPDMFSKRLSKLIDLDFYMFNVTVRLI